MNDRSVKWQRYRDEEFGILVTRLANRAAQYNWSCWTGGSKNPYSITLSASIPPDRHAYCSIRLAKGAYMAADCADMNPNNTKRSRYTIYVGNTVGECEEFAWRKMEDFRAAYGDPTGLPVRFTTRYRNKRQQREIASQTLQALDWYQSPKSYALATASL